MNRWMLACFALLTMLFLVTSPAAAKPANNGGTREQWGRQTVPEREVGKPRSRGPFRGCLCQ